jgi:hypothetical protein
LLTTPSPPRLTPLDRHHGDLPVKDCFRILGQIAAALEYLAQNATPHRAVCASAVLLVSTHTARLTMPKSVVHPHDFFKDGRPLRMVRWMAPEVLKCVCPMYPAVSHDCVVTSCLCTRVSCGTLIGTGRSRPLPTCGHLALSAMKRLLGPRFRLRGSLTPRRMIKSMPVSRCLSELSASMHLSSPPVVSTMNQTAAQQPQLCTSRLPRP